MKTGQSWRDVRVPWSGCGVGVVAIAKVQHIVRGLTALFQRRVEIAIRIVIPVKVEDGVVFLSLAASK